MINNAGISLHRHALRTTPADVERVMRVNFLSAVQITMAALPSMVERGQGSVVNITSVAGVIPNPRESAYGASKAALHLWSHGLAVDLHGTGVHVGVLSPGPIDTEIWDKDETPSNYHGRKYPPEIVADGVARMIDKEIVQLTVPRQFGAMGPLYACRSWAAPCGPGWWRSTEPGIAGANGPRRCRADASAGYWSSLY